MKYLSKARVIAWLLSLVMIVALVPEIPVYAEAEEVYEWTEAVEAASEDEMEDTILEEEAWIEEATQTEESAVIVEEEASIVEDVPIAEEDSGIEEDSDLGLEEHHDDFYSNNEMFYLNRPSANGIAPLAAGGNNFSDLWNRRWAAGSVYTMDVPRTIFGTGLKAQGDPARLGTLTTAIEGTINLTGSGRAYQAKFNIGGSAQTTVSFGIQMDSQSGMNGGIYAGRGVFLFEYQHNDGVHGNGNALYVTYGEAPVGGNVHIRLAYYRDTGLVAFFVNGTMVGNVPVDLNPLFGGPLEYPQGSLMWGEYFGVNAQVTTAFGGDSVRGVFNNVKITGPMQPANSSWNTWEMNYWGLRVTSQSGTLNNKNFVIEGTSTLPPGYDWDRFPVVNGQWHPPVGSAMIPVTTNRQIPYTFYGDVDYSAVYNFEEYIARYSDLRAAFGSNSLGALAHFVNAGMREGRQGSTSFHVTSYRLRYQDLRRAFGNDLRSYYLHYINAGRREGRVATGTTTLQNPVTVMNGVNYSSVYDFTAYSNRYGDLRNAFGLDDAAMLAHFVNAGMREGRQGSTSFHVTSYRLRYQDLRRAFGNDLRSYYLHYINAGRREGRVATGTTTLQNPVTVMNGVNYSSVYDFTAYSNRYGDLRNAFGLDDAAMLAHFVNVGMREGRQGSTSFHVTSYRLRYQDLRRAFGNDLRSYYLHYINAGRREGRVATGTTTLQNPVTVLNGVDYRLIYDFTTYFNRYPDLQRAFGQDDIALLTHFVNAGMREGRIAHPNFNVHHYRANYRDLRDAFGNDLARFFHHYRSQGGPVERRVANRRL